MNKNIERALAILTDHTLWVSKNSKRLDHTTLLKEDYAKFFFQLPLTASDLQVIARMWHDQPVMYAHPGWTLEALVETVTNYGTTSGIAGAMAGQNNIERLEILAAERPNDWWFMFASQFARVDHHSPEVLAWFLGQEQYVVCTRPALPEQAVTKAIISLNLEEEIDWRKAIRMVRYLSLKPNLDSNMLGWIGEVLDVRYLKTHGLSDYGRKETFKQIAVRHLLGESAHDTYLAVASNPETPSTTLTAVHKVASTKAVMLALAAHPNTEKNVLRKIASRADGEIRAAAVAALD